MTVEDVQKIFELPWLTLITLASGYIAYFIANFGDREHHKTVDIIFSVFVFGAICAAIFRWLEAQSGVGTTGATIGAFITAILAGALWSWVGRDWLGVAVRKTNISHSNDLTTIHAELARQKGKVNVTQLEVCLISGEVLTCDDLSLFNDDPNGHFGFGSPPGRHDWLKLSETSPQEHKVKRVVSQCFGKAVPKRTKQDKIRPLRLWI